MPKSKPYFTDSSHSKIIGCVKTQKVDEAFGPRKLRQPEGTMRDQHAPLLHCFALWPGGGSVLRSCSCCAGTGEQKDRILGAEQGSAGGRTFQVARASHAARYFAKGKMA